MQRQYIPKITNYVEEVIPSYNYSTFKSHFRMTPGCFEQFLMIMGNVRSLRKRHHGGRPIVPLQKMLLMVLWILGTPESFRSIGDRFNVCKSTVFHCLHRVARVINSELCKLYIKWPEEGNRGAESMGKYGINYAIGAVDGCHIPITKPILHGYDYFNRKKFYSMVLQGICNGNLLFIDVDIRWPGGVHDARVFRTSDIFQVLPNLCEPNFFVLGDSAYPLSKWVLTPYKNYGQLTPVQLNYNKIHSKTRVKIEHAFGLLKGRFRRLRDCLDIKEAKDIVEIVVASCVLHNMCIVHGQDDNIQDYINEGQHELLLLNFDEDRNVEHEGIIRRNQVSEDLWNRHQRI